MPDWTYHPCFRPILFRLPAETARRITLGLLDLQGRTPAGRALFRAFGHVEVPKELAVEAFGLNFPGPIGLGTGIDNDGAALAIWRYLGFGFVELGPAGAEAVPRRHATDPRRLPAYRSIVWSDRWGGPSAAELGERIARATNLSIPVGLTLRGPGIVAAAEQTPASIDFVIAPADAADDRLERIKRAADRPTLLALSPDDDDQRIAERIERAVAAGIDGFVACAGTSTNLMPGGSIRGPQSRARAIELVERAARTNLPVIGATGIESPQDAVDFLHAGATLVSLAEGFVYAGPGLPGRIIHALEDPTRAIQSEPEPIPIAANVRRWSWPLVVFTGIVLIASGITALLLATFEHMLPPDEIFLGMNADELCLHHDCRIVRFMIHDRYAFGGSIISVGLVYVWLGGVALRRGEAWAFWATALSGLLGFSSFLTYLGYGYLDPWHGVATLLLLPWFVIGLVGSFRGAAHPRGPATLLRLGATSWRWSPATMGRVCVGFAAFGMIAGGLTIMIVGMTSVFVPQDLDYMGLTVAQLDAVSPRLVSLIAHDRAGFGGGLCSGGIAIAACLWCGVRPASPGLWVTLLLAGFVGFTTAIGIHFVVGYTDFFHLLPAYAGAIAFLIGMVLLYRPMCRTDILERRFADL